LVNLAQLLVSAGKDEESLILTERAEELHPGLSLVAAYRGRILEKIGRADEAFVWYSKAVQRDPQALMPLTRLGAAYVARQDWATARDYFERSLRVVPTTAPNTLRTELHVGLGRAFAGLKRWTDAQREYRRALSFTPQSAEASAGLDEAVRQSSAAGKPPSGP
jgi:tetratricopeptide (TPR) repeat protein